ncbi:MAG: aspartate 1-decarboxylase [Phycisphaerales bacterium]
MFRKVLHSKVHMATVTAARPDYVGSITIDRDLMDAVGLRASDAVLVANCRSGARFETYVFEGRSGGGQIEVNGAAAHLVEPGDQVIILHFAFMTDEQYNAFKPRVVIPTPDNKVARVLNYEPTLR